MLREVSLLADEAHAEALADALIEAGALSVSVEDADADSPDEQALFGEPGLEPERQAWKRSRLTVLIDGDPEVDALLEHASAAAGAPRPRVLASAEVADTDWVRSTQAQFPPTQISPRLWVVPTWHEPPDPAAINVRLDPGVAFGTGTHPTTRLCLAWLDAALVPGSSVLDYGCGSGILAVAAALLGAGEVLGTDIDPQAVEAARLNAEANGARARFVLPAALPAGSFDAVVANILSNPLKVLAPALLARVAPGGALVLSGVLERQAEEVIAAYALIDPAVPLAVWRADEGWVCLAGRRS
ncbi:MAG TPA: 50S ribosomal protein L11 methyltransferase [Burkholderiaceae bacterium]|nr:50S ribosomal protein L11 methyltransferase [Burkholderiaceae bacterium]HRZ00002.1 50S ribosomal protein L11 methyltransferase [Burkholderiaceae bacterium]